MNVFSSLEFLETYWDAFGDGSPPEVQVFELEGLRFPLLVGRGRPVTRPELTDFLEPIGAAEPGFDRPVRGSISFLPRVALSDLRTPDGCPDLGGSAVAPYLNWSRVPDAASLDAHLAHLNSRRAADSRRQVRRVEREVGPINYSISNQPGTVLEACLAWKVEQHPSASGLVKDPRRRRFIDGLLDAGIADVAALRAGDTLLAAHVGLRYGGRRYYWIPSYSADYARFSPGRLLLEHSLLESQRRGDSQFDFLIGNEQYKWDFATDARLIRPLGRKPVMEAAIEGTRARLRLGRKLNAVKQKVRRS